MTTLLKRALAAVVVAVAGVFVHAAFAWLPEDFELDEEE